MNLPPRNLLRYTYETLHFVFHYTYTTQSAARTDRRYDASLPISAQHGIRNFSYVENYSAYFETAWQFYIDSPLGFSPPPGVSADKKYEVYIYQMDAYGVTFPERIFPNGAASSFIGARNNYDGFGGNDDIVPEQGCMKVTAAHEFFHPVRKEAPLLACGGVISPVLGRGLKPRPSFLTGFTPFNSAFAWAE